ncbi:MAG: flagellar basal-body rod protein FlgF [Pseudomonadota bacterium]
MDRSIYLAMSAAKHMLNAQSLASHNLANVSTTGFKSDFQAFRAMPVYGSGHASRVYAHTERPGIDFSAGTIETTGNELDIAINGEGFIAVRAPDGSEAYTRAGALATNLNGQLQTSGGHLVLGNGGPIAVPPAQSLVVGVDGTISVRPVGQEANTLAQVDRIKLVNPASADLEKGADGLFRLRSGAPAPVDAGVRVTRGALEASNVNPVSEMVNLISHARQYEMAIKTMQTTEELDAATARLLRLNG